MKLVMNVPDYIKEQADDGNAVKFGIPVWLAFEIAYGTPLPKGHGRLISEPTEEDIAKTIGGQNDFAEYIREAVKAVFDNAPTIIESDTAESEGEVGESE